MFGKESDEDSDSDNGCKYSSLRITLNEVKVNLR